MKTLYDQHPIISLRQFLIKWHFRILIFLPLYLFVNNSYAQAPVAPPGTNLQSWLGNTFSVFTDMNTQERVPEGGSDIKLGNGVLFFAGYHERGGGGASFNISDGSFAGRYAGFNTGFGDPVSSVAADDNHVYFGTREQGVQKYVYGGSISPVAVYLPGKSITGLCIKNGKMYISNWTDNKIHVFTVSTMTEDASWTVTNPIGLTVDNNGKIWVIQWDPTSTQDPNDGPIYHGKNILSYSNTGVQGASITDFEKPKCIAIDQSGLLLVGGLNEHSQIWKYGNLTGTPTQVGTFGVLNGIFSGTSGQFTNTAKLHWINSIDVDATGNIYVACRYGTFWGVSIEKFSPSGDLLWRNFCGSSLDCAGIDPENDTEVYSKYHHYSLDYSKTTPGSEWSLKGFTVNRFKYPNDYRVNFLNDVGERSLGQGAVRIQGKLFMMRSYQSQYDLEIYRFDNANDGEVAIPSVIFQGGNDGILTFNPGTGNWVTTPGNTNYKQCWDICSNGDVYSLAQVSNSYSHINKFPFQGFDSFGNPIYNTSTTLPIPGNGTYRASGLAYDQATNCQYLIASKNTDADGVNKYIRCIQNWNTTPTEKWSVRVPFNNLQYTPQTNYGGGRVLAIDVAGDYVFLAYGYGHIRILDKHTGLLIGTLAQNVNGWIGTEGQIDAKCGLNVTKRSNGEYVILFENATMGNIQMHRWQAPAYVPAAEDDLVVINPSVNSALDFGETINIQVYSNDNNNSIAKVEFYLNDVLAHTSTSLNSGYHNYEFVNPPPKTYNFYAKSYDIDNVTVHTSSTVNFVVNTQTFLPDLIVSDIKYTPTSPKAGDLIKFSATIKNKGLGKTQEGVVIGGVFHVDGVAVAYSDTYTTSVQAGESVDIVATGGFSPNQFWLSTAGDHKLSFNIDDVNRIAESNEANNFTYKENLCIDCAVTPVTAVTLDLSSLVLNPGNSKQLKATISPINASNINVSWSSSNATIATVDANGLVTGIAAGTATITVTTQDGSKTAVSAITVQTGEGTVTTISTTAVSSVTSTTASSGGNVTIAGSSAVTVRGVVWSTTANPTVTLTTKTVNGSGTGTFTSSITGLTAGTTYNVRAYATNSAGTSYGSNVVFTATTESGGSVSVYPNPATNVVTVDLGQNLGSKQTLVEVLDMQGRKVYTSGMINGVSTLQLNTSEYSKGVYLIRISLGTESVTKKVMIE